MEPISMPDLACVKCEDHYLLRDSMKGLFLAASKYPKNRETRAPKVSEINHLDIEISEQAVLDPIPTQFNVTMTEPSNNVFVSSAFFGNLDSNFKNAQHSVAIYHSTYTGNIKIQASLMQTSPQGDDRHADWFDVVSNIAIAGTSDILHKTFAVNCNWVRVISYPADANSTISNIHVRN